MKYFLAFALVVAALALLSDCTPAQIKFIADHAPGCGDAASKKTGC